MENFKNKSLIKVNLSKITQLAQANIRQHKPWHFHLLTPHCQFNREPKHAFLLEDISSSKTYVAYSVKPQMALGKRLLKLLHGIDVNKKVKDPKPASPKVKSILKLAQELTSQGMYWHHHMLLPDCALSRHPGKWVIIFEDQKHHRLLESASLDEPVSDLMLIESLYYQQKSLD